MSCNFYNGAAIRQQERALIENDTAYAMNHALKEEVELVHQRGVAREKELVSERNSALAALKKMKKSMAKLLPRSIRVFLSSQINQLETQNKNMMLEITRLSSYGSTHTLQEEILSLKRELEKFHSTHPHSSSSPSESFLQQRLVAEREVCHKR